MRKLLYKIKLSFVLLGIGTGSLFAQKSALKIEDIMKGHKWMGTSPSNVFWSEDSKSVYFNWNPDQAPGDSLYYAHLKSMVPQKVPVQQRRELPSNRGVYNKNKTQKLYIKNGDIFVYNVASGKTVQLTNTLDAISQVSFNLDESKIIYTLRNNLYSVDLKNGSTIQLTDFKKGNEPAELTKDKQDQWLKDDQFKLISVVKERTGQSKLAEAITKTEQPKRPKAIFTGNKNVGQIKLSPDERYVTYQLSQQTSTSKNTIVPNYVTESGYVEDISARSKVGSPQISYENWIYHIEKDTTYQIDISSIPGIKDRPDYINDYVALKEKEAKERSLFISPPVWSENGKNAFVVVRSMDNKDRWIMLLDPEKGSLSSLDRQRDEAWIAGPGIGWKFSTGNVGWMPDGKRVWFHSEESGFSHLYAVDIHTKEKKALTKGQYEVFEAFISEDKKHWYYTSNEVHPGELHFYKMPLEGGKAIKLTSMEGQNTVELSPDEKYLAINYSYTNKPWELFLQENKPNAKPIKVTNSLTRGFEGYHWRDPEIISFKASDEQKVYARIYEPSKEIKNNAAVIFVHGAGYLQNAHKGWSSYFREYMFHNILTDEGYTVLDIDFRASAGYGRDFRTGIYRHMGGKDLSDQVDGAKLLVEKYGIDADRIGIYGGSYGGFITLMGMFNEPEVFSAGAALRSVTDWAHYNHLYTSNILNEPYTDSLAYARSSPIYYAEGLKGNLLICHGMIDTNVHFQDVVRLSQRLIELGKDNWELAVYPMEDHGFIEPSSWTDEYKRIKALFDKTIKNRKVNISFSEQSE